MLEIGLPRLRLSQSFLQDLSRAVSRFSRGPVAGNHRQHIFDPTGPNTITIYDRIENNVIFDPIGVCNPVGSQKVLTVVSCNWAPGEAGNNSGQILEKTLILRRGRPISQHFRGKSSCERTETYFFNGLQIQLH